MLRSDVLHIRRLPDVKPLLLIDPQERLTYGELKITDQCAFIVVVLVMSLVTAGKEEPCSMPTKHAEKNQRLFHLTIQTTKPNLADQPRDDPRRALHVDVRHHVATDPRHHLEAVVALPIAFDRETKFCDLPRR